MKTQNKISWENREADLIGVKRYYGENAMATMFYRTDLLIHTQRVPAIIRELIPTVRKFYPHMNFQQSLLMGVHHDDYEIDELKLGDIPMTLKLAMSEEEKKNLYDKEIAAIDVLTEIYPKMVGGFNYRDLLLRSVYKDSLEIQLCSFADKIDGWCESIHELFAGNNLFLGSSKRYPLKIFNNLPETFPLIADVFKTDNKLFHFDVQALLDKFDAPLSQYEPHTIESIFEDSGIPQYEIWKQVTLHSFQNGLDLLTKQIEFLK